jgi:hypothetical protein
VVGRGVRRWVADAAGEEMKAKALPFIAFEHKRFVPDSPSPPAARISATRWLVYAASGFIFFSRSSCSRLPLVCFGDIFGFRGDLDPGRDIRGPNLGNAAPRSPHF